MNKVKKYFKNFRFTRKVFSYPYILFLLIFVVTPLVMVLVRAFMTDAADALTFKNFADFFNSTSSLRILGDSLIIAVLTCTICILIGYPIAYILTKYNSGRVLVLLFILPMWVNFLIRTLATKAVFELFGMTLGLGTVLFGMVYNFLPFMILPIYTSLSSLDKHFAEAASDLGATPSQVIFKTILPLSAPGIISGLTMVFIPTISTFAISQLLSNGTIYLFGDSIYTKFTNNLFGVGSVMSLVMLIFVLISNFALRKFNKGNVSGRSVW